MKSNANVIPFACPKCGSEVLIARIKLKSVSDIGGTVCKGCGYGVTQDDIINHARDVALKMIAKMKR
jgi:transcription elongation factor Elf1